MLRKMSNRLRRFSQQNRVSTKSIMEEINKISAMEEESNGTSEQESIYKRDKKGTTEKMDKEKE